jgi:hypothetical protein
METSSTITAALDAATPIHVPVPLAAITVALWVARVVIFAVLHTMRAPRHLVGDTVSDYANGPTGRLYTVMSVCTALAWVSTAATVLFGLPEWDYRIPCAVLLLIAAVTPLLMLAAPIPEKGRPLGVQGVVHYGLAIVNFAAAYSPMDRIAGLTGNPVLSALHIVALIGLIAFCASLVLRKLRKLHSITGLLERVFLWSVVLFYLVFSLLLALS